MNTQYSSGAKNDTYSPFIAGNPIRTLNAKPK